MSPTITDLFCGAGGSGVGAEAAGFELVMAANHWRRAIETHAANFPHTEHDCADISQVDPRRYRATDVLWASPECTNHSQANGQRRVDGQPDLFGETLTDEAAERSRATMWDVPRFAEAMLLRARPYRAIVVENVVEAARWIYFGAWLAAMDAAGYQHQIVSLNSMHAPTIAAPRAPQSRDRLYIVYPDYRSWAVVQVTPRDRLSRNSVGQVRDTWRVENPREVQLDLGGVQAVEQADTATEHDGNQVDDKLVEQARAQALLNDARAHEDDVLARSSASRLLDGGLDALGDERVGRLTSRHRVGSLVGHDEQRQPGHRSSATPRPGHLVGATARDYRATLADALIEEVCAGSRHLERRIQPARRVTGAQPLMQPVAAVVLVGDKTIDGCRVRSGDRGHRVLQEGCADRAVVVGLTCVDEYAVTNSSPAGVLGVGGRRGATGHAGERNRLLGQPSGSPAGSSGGLLWLAEFGEQASDALGDALVAFDFSRPAAFACVGDELFFDGESFAQPGCVVGCGDERGAAEVEVAFAGSFVGQAQAAAEFEFGLVEVGLDPVDGVLLESALVVPYYGAADTARSAGAPLGALTTRDRYALLVPSGGTWNDTAYPATDPMRTRTASEAEGVAFLAQLKGNTSRPWGIDDPLSTVQASGNHHMLVRHNSSKGDGAEMCTPASEPARTITTTGHQSLVALAQQVEDATFRMLEPHEIQAAMAFTADYTVTGTRRERVRQLGNGVTPPAAEFLLRAAATSLDAGAA